MKYQEL